VLYVLFVACLEGTAQSGEERNEEREHLHRPARQESMLIITQSIACSVPCRYGLPFVSPNNMLVSTINGAGAAIEAVYVVIFLAFASSQRTRLRMLGLASAVSAAFAAVALASMLALHGQGRKLMCGLAATVCSICMYASPLSIMVYVSFHGISDNYIVRHCTYGSLTVSFVRACRGWW
jgi:hypothetical protein